MSNSRTQNILARQILRQIRWREQKENQRLHRELRHRYRELKTVDEHFDGLRGEVCDLFEEYNKQVEDVIAVNKMRFNLRINERLETILDHDYRINCDDIDIVIDGDSDVLDTLHSKSNSMLFFGSLHPTANTNANNDNFYKFLCMIMTMYAMYALGGPTLTGPTLVNAIMITPPCYCLLQLWIMSNLS